MMHEIRQNFKFMTRERDELVFARGATRAGIEFKLAATQDGVGAAAGASDEGAYAG